MKHDIKALTPKLLLEWADDFVEASKKFERLEKCILLTRAQQCREAASALSLTAGEAVAAGWKLVPITPTDAMKREGWHVLREKNDFQTRLGNSLVGTETPIYEAMLAAAPAPPAAPAASDASPSGEDWRDIDYVDLCKTRAPEMMAGRVVGIGRAHAIRARPKTPGSRL